MKLYRDSVEKIIHEAPIPAYYVDEKRMITYWNQPAYELTGFEAATVVGSYCFNNILNHIDEDNNRLCLGGCPLRDTISTGTINQSSKIILQHLEGHRISVTVKTIPVYEEDKIVGAVEFFTQTQHHLCDNKSRSMGANPNYDQLTNLPILKFLEHEFVYFVMNHRFSGCKFALVVFDIDNLDEINQNFGVTVGDKVIKSASKSLINNLSLDDAITVSNKKDFYCLVNFTSTRELIHKIEWLRLCLENTSTRINLYEIEMTCSIGASVYSEGDNLEKVKDRAISSLNIAKTEGRNQLVLDID